MKLSRLMQIVEADLGGHLGFGGRPDDTGIRGKGVNRKPVKGMPEFPYDREITYGQPGMATGRGDDSVVSANHSNVMIPRDDSTFSLTLMDLEEIVREAMGSPMNLKKSGSSQMGSTIPGVGSGWANNPAKEWDAEGDVGPVDDTGDAPEAEDG